MNDESSDTCEVCIVGAGIAGMNALVVASGYLSRADKVVLVDKRPRVGGMWVDTYDYVRLHQLHGLSLSLHNLSVMTDALPSRTFLDCGLDYDRWYPMPRRMAGIARLMSTHRRDRKHHQKTLDTLRERFDIRCGPLS